ncbi:MAG: S-adenosyl-l-methionine hydroxide adenosyltransferase family protein [Erysipelotrichaceae bacterium]|nr:S-adenosyl-l-methionine hydroxide adenosyltransferase family protein [Erysipelotrichaceae bacterium]
MRPLILQTDFGTSDGAVSAMYGVAYSVNENLRIFDLTHDIQPYDIWEASYRLIQTVNYWKEGSVFVSVVDPGVGSDRKSVVVKTAGGQYIVTPDNGTLTHMKKIVGIVEAREIDESINRLPNSGESYTFHGRDIYAYTGARLASGVIDFEGVGPLIDVEDIVELKTIAPKKEDNMISGTIDVLDIRFGSLWTNIPRTLFKELNVQFGDYLEICIEHDHRIAYKNMIVYARSFADVSTGETLLYTNSLDHMAVAINQGSFAKAYNVGTGTSWKIAIKKI